MRRGRISAALLLATSLGTPAKAGLFADDLTRCTISSTTPADRTVLLRWMFLVAATNPSLADLSSIGDRERDRGYRAAAAVFNRILLHDCRRQTLEALRNEGPAAIGAAFQALGQLAGREMMSSAASAAALDQLGALMDMPGLEALGREAGVRMGPPAASPQ